MFQTPNPGAVGEINLNRQRHAIITGGGTGIGAACAEHLTHSGWNVTCIGLERKDPWPDGIDFCALDVSDNAEVERFLKNTGPIDGLVNCAGTILHDALEFTTSGFNQVVGVNLNAVNHVTLAALPALKAAKGAVVNIASMWSQFGSSRNPAYSASKGGISALTRSHAVAFAPHGIRVNAVAPGWIETKLASNAMKNPERSSAIMSRIALGRWGQPEDVAKVVGFLLSEDAQYVTGVILPVDGGYSIT